jgi:hypothetical protein
VQFLSGFFNTDVCKLRFLIVGFVCHLLFDFGNALQNYCDQDDGKCQCQATGQWTGDHCEIGCAPSCRNGGQCFIPDNATATECVCIKCRGEASCYEGATCEQCQEGFFGGSCKKCAKCVHGTCQDGINGDGHCACTTIFFLGKHCETFSTKGKIAAGTFAGTFFLLGFICLAPWHTRMAVYKTGKFLGMPVSRPRPAGEGWRIGDKFEPFLKRITERSRAGGAADWLIDPTKLHLGAMIGVGSSAQLLEATYCGQQVAVKRLQCSTWEEGTFEEFFAREAAVLCRLQHPNLVRFFGASQHANYLYLVTELCVSSLADFMYREGTGRPPLPYAP